jgi:hypothetical protein
VLDHPCGRHRLVGALLTAPLSLLLLFAAYGKLFVPTPADAPVKLEALQLQTLAVIDLLLAVGMFVPRVSTLSYVLTVGYFGGATATHLTHGMTFGLQAGLIVFTLVCAYFRAPELFLRLLGKSSTAEGAVCKTS